MGKFKQSFCRKVSFLTGHHNQFQSVGLCMNQTWLNQLYPLFHAQLNLCDQHNHQTLNYAAKGHGIYSAT